MANLRTLNGPGGSLAPPMGRRLDPNRGKPVDPNQPQALPGGLIPPPTPGGALPPGKGGYNPSLNPMYSRTGEVAAGDGTATAGTGPVAPGAPTGPGGRELGPFAAGVQQNLQERWGEGNPGETPLESAQYRMADRGADRFGRREEAYGNLGMDKMEDVAGARGDIRQGIKDRIEGVPEEVTPDVTQAEVIPRDPALGSQTPGDLADQIVPEDYGAGSLPETDLESQVNENLLSASQGNLTNPNQEVYQTMSKGYDRAGDTAARMLKEQAGKSRGLGGGAHLMEQGRLAGDISQKKGELFAGLQAKQATEGIKAAKDQKDQAIRQQMNQARTELAKLGIVEGSVEFQNKMDYYYSQLEQSQSQFDDQMQQQNMQFGWQQLFGGPEMGQLSSLLGIVQN